jgi:hypothetical protein
MRKSRKVKGGKRSLYNPKMGSSNYRKAEQGRFANHPAFAACRNLAGVSIALQRLISGGDKMELRLTATARQLETALLCLLEAKKLKTPGDKIRFAEAMAAYRFPENIGGTRFSEAVKEIRELCRIGELPDREKPPDENVWRVCWRAIEMRTTQRENPSQAELRHAVEREEGIKLSDEEWKRLIKRTGLNKKLPTHRQKKQRGTLPKV